MAGISVSTISKATNGIDRWFIYEIQKIVNLEKEMAKYDLDTLPIELLREAKANGFSDEQISRITEHGDEEDVYNKRKLAGIMRVYKMVDTCSAEFEAKTPYFYSTFEEGHFNESKPSDKKKIIVLGSGPNRIGQGIEFDYCCVHAAMTVRKSGMEAVMINCNPETVSTDYDTSDRLYFEPLTLEHVLAVVEVEQPQGLILQFGGQTPLKLAAGLAGGGAPLLGTSVQAIDLAEDRGQFGALLEKLGFKAPPFATANSVAEALDRGDEVGYPLLVRPSYVLGGRAMEIVYSRDGLADYLARQNSAPSSPDAATFPPKEDAKTPGGAIFLA